MANIVRNECTYEIIGTTPNAALLQETGKDKYLIVYDAEVDEAGNAVWDDSKVIKCFNKEEAINIWKVLSI